MGIKSIIERDDTAAGKLFDLFIQFLIIVSLVSFSIETVPALSKETVRVLRIIEITTVIIFTIEYFLRIFVSDRKFKYIFSFYGIVDFLAVLPFYVSSGIDLRSIRIVRLFRLFRTFKFFRYGNAMRNLHMAFLAVKRELLLFLLMTGFLLYVSSVGIYYFEHSAQPEQFKSIFHCLWWAIVTLTTVGYGDMYPVTTGGKIFTSFITLIGIGVVAVPTGLVASALTKVLKDEDDKR